MVRTVAASATIAALITSVQAQGITPNYGPDGRAYYRRTPDTVTYAPQPALEQQPYAMPQRAPAPTTAPSAPREQKVKVKPKPKPKRKLDALKPQVDKTPEATAAVPQTNPDPPPPPTERNEIKLHPLAEMVRTGSQRKSAALPKRGITESAAMTQLTRQLRPRTIQARSLSICRWERRVNSASRGSRG